MTRADDTVESFALGHVAHKFVAGHMKHDACHDTMDEEKHGEEEEEEYEEIAI